MRAVRGYCLCNADGCVLHCFVSFLWRKMHPNCGLKIDVSIIQFFQGNRSLCKLLWNMSFLLFPKKVKWRCPIVLSRIRRIKLQDIEFIAIELELWWFGELWKFVWFDDSIDCFWIGSRRDSISDFFRSVWRKQLWIIVWEWLHPHSFKF